MLHEWGSGISPIPFILRNSRLLRAEKQYGTLKKSRHEKEREVRVGEIKTKKGNSKKE